MRILCLPIDSRPCNTQFIRRLTAWAGHELVLPRKEEMDDFRCPAPYAGSFAFIKRELPRCGAAVISLDHWCYGSLLASREEGVSEAEALTVGRRRFCAVFSSTSRCSTVSSLCCTLRLCSRA